MKNNSKKRMLSLFLSASMIFSQFAPALAEDTLGMEQAVLESETELFAEEGPAEPEISVPVEMETEIPIDIETEPDLQETEMLTEPTPEVIQPETGPAENPETGPVLPETEAQTELLTEPLETEETVPEGMERLSCIKDNLTVEAELADGSLFTPDCMMEVRTLDDMVPGEKEAYLKEIEEKAFPLLPDGMDTAAETVGDKKLSNDTIPVMVSFHENGVPFIPDEVFYTISIKDPAFLEDVKQERFAVLETNGNGEWAIIQEEDLDVSISEEQETVHLEFLSTEQEFLFVNWMDEIDISNSYDLENTNELQAGTVTLTFDPNGGSSPSFSSIQKNSGEEIGALPTTSKEGYQFLGWAEQASGLELKFNSSCATEGINYDWIYIYYNDSSGNIHRMGKYGGSNFADAVIQIPSNEFWIYFRSDSGINNYGFAFDYIQNASVTSASSSVSVSDTVITSLPNISAIETVGSVYPETPHDYKENQTMMWHYTGFGDTISEGSLVPETDTTYYALWDPIQYTVVFDGNGGTSSSITKRYQEALGTLPISGRPFYTFKGWYTSETGGTIITSSTTVPLGGATYYAQWEEQTGPFAILYEDGELVFQTDTEIDSSKGEILGSYSGFETKGYTYEKDVPWYQLRSSIKTVNFKNEISPTSIAYWFNKCENLTEVKNCNNLKNTYTSMLSAFSYCSNLRSIDTSSWTLENVKNMYLAFRDCENLVSLDTSNWSLDQVTTMDSTFYGCTKLEEINTSNWGNLNSLINISSAFYGCESITRLDTSRWTLENVTDMANMFQNCFSLIEVDSSNWNLANVEHIGNIFYNCSNLVSIGNSNWGLTNKVKSMAYMFTSCRNLTAINVSSWDTSNVTSLRSTFTKCEKLEILDTKNWDLSMLEDMTSAFSDCTNLSSLDTSGWVLDKVTTMESAFINCISLIDLDTSKWSLSSVRTMSQTFSGCGISFIDASKWSLSNLTSLNYTFYKCVNLTSIDISGWDLCSLDNMAYTFAECKKLTSLDTSSWNLSNLTKMYWTFKGCKSLTFLDTSNWGTLDKVTDMYYAFASCENLRSIDTSSWTLSSVRSVNYTFGACKSLSYLNQIVTL